VKKGIVAFSFALRSEAEEPNPCNIKLAKEVERLVDEELAKNPAERPVIVAQWEVARQLEADGYDVDMPVNLNQDGTYLDSEGVWKKAVWLFNTLHIRQVIPVAQPFLQMTKIKRMIKADGFVVADRKIKWIGFDNDPRNTQPWTKGPIRLFVYAVRQTLFGSRGN
jgi:hypothetical protein